MTGMTREAAQQMFGISIPQERVKLVIHPFWEWQSDEPDTSIARAIIGRAYAVDGGVNLTLIRNVTMKNSTGRVWPGLGLWRGELLVVRWSLMIPPGHSFAATERG